MQARRRDDGARDLDLLLAKLKVDIAAVTAGQADIARKAFRRLWPWTPCSQSQLWRLFCVCLSEGQVGAIAVQRR
jgi:hypothetical protein